MTTPRSQSTHLSVRKSKSGSEEQHGTMIIAKEIFFFFFFKYFEVAPTNFLHALNQIQNLKALAKWVCMTNLGLG